MRLIRHISPPPARSKWVVFLIWVVGILIAAGPAKLPDKFADAENNESTSFLPGDAESTKALTATEDLQGGELAPAVIVYERDSGLTPADLAKIGEDVVRLTEKRYPGVVPDGATAAAGGEAGGASEGARRAGAAPSGQPEGCGGPTTEIPGQPSDYAPFVGPICSEDGKAAIVTAYLKGDGEGDTILDPVQFWRDTVSDPGGGLEVKITGGAGYAADAIEVFESINGTLLLAAVTLVIVLLILIYRSPIFLFIPLAAVMFAEVLARSLGYGLSELGVTINGQSSSIMSIMVLGAGTDYALLIVARYREELHHTLDRHEAMAAAMRSAGPAVLASAATVIAALFCLMIAKVNGTSGMGPIVAMGVACAALSMLTLLPALLTIFGRRAFWPFVPHSTEWLAPEGVQAGRMRRRIADGPRWTALLLVVGASLIVLAAAAARDRQLAAPQGHARADPVAHRGSARPRRLQAVRAAPLPARAPRGRDPRLLEAGRRLGRAAPAPSRDRLDGRPARALRRARVLLDRPHHQRQLPHQGRVGGGAGDPQQELPGRMPAPRSTSSFRTARTCPRSAAPCRGAEGVEGVSGPVAQGDRGVLVQAVARAAALFDRRLRPDRPDPRRGPRRRRRARWSAARARSSSTCARRPRGTPR